MTYPIRTVSYSDLDIGDCIGSGAEQSAFELVNDPDHCLKITHVHLEATQLVDNSLDLAADGLAPDVVAVVTDEHGKDLGVIVDKCIVFESVKEPLLDELERNPLEGYDEDDMLSLIESLDHGEYWAIDDCLQYGTPIVKDLAEDCDAFFQAAEDLRMCGLKDMHVYNVGIDRRGDYVCIDTAGYVRSM